MSQGLYRHAAQLQTRQCRSSKDMPGRNGRYPAQLQEAAEGLPSGLQRHAAEVQTGRSAEGQAAGQNTGFFNSEVVATIVRDSVAGFRSWPPPKSLLSRRYPICGRAPTPLDGCSPREAPGLLPEVLHTPATSGVG
jgi:hypothetical protein